MSVATLSEHQIRTFGGNIYTIPDVLHEYYEEEGWMTPEELSVCLKATGWDSKVERQKIAAKMVGVFRVITPEHGDKRVTWRRTVLAEIHAAKQMFMDLISQGMVPYRVGVDGKASVEKMEEFDPLAEEVVFLPMKMVGGG